MIKKEELKLVTEWDKTFPKSDKVDHSKVTFVNRYGITLAAEAGFPQSQYAVPLVQLRNSAADCMRRRWRKEVFLQLHLILLLPEKVAET